MGEHSLWGHLSLLLQSSSLESVEYILQALWRTRRTGLDDADRKIIREMLDLPADSDLDPLLVCLRILMRKCVYENIAKDEIHKLFPNEVLPELRKCLTFVLQKSQRDWREDVHQDMVSLPRLKAMTWNMANRSMDAADPNAVIHLKLQVDAQSLSGETEVNFQISEHTLGAMVKSLYMIRDQLLNHDDILNECEQSQQDGTT